MKVKTKLQIFFALKKAVQYNILIKITKVLFDTHNLTENTGLRYFLYRIKKIQKSNESENCENFFE